MKQEIEFTRNAIKHYSNVYSPWCKEVKKLKNKYRKLKRWQRKKESIDKRYKRFMKRWKSETYNFK